MSQTNYTLDQLAALEGSIAEGALEVEYSDKKVRYRTLSEMLKIRDMMRSALGVDKGCKKNGLFGGKRLHMIHSKGLD